MGKRKRKLSAAEKAAKRKRRQEYMTIFINGRMKRIRRPPTVEGMSVDDFIRANADPVFLHQEEMWEQIEMEHNEVPLMKRRPVLTADAREQVSFITVEDDIDLVVGYAIALDDTGEIASLIMQRTPLYEFLLPPEERGVLVSHELDADDVRGLLRRIVIARTRVDIETTVRTYRLDTSHVEPAESVAARNVLQQMHEYGRFQLDLE